MGKTGKTNRLKRGMRVSVESLRATWRRYKKGDVNSLSESVGVRRAITSARRAACEAKENTVLTENPSHPSNLFCALGVICQ